MSETNETNAATGTIKIIDSEEEFGRVASNGVAAIDFFAKWCGPCRMTAPILESLARKFAGRATVAKVDVDANQALATKYEISAIPTILIFRDGAIVQRLTGVQSEEDLSAAVEDALSSVRV